VNNDSRFKVPVNVAVKEPWAGVVSGEADSNFIAICASAHNVADGRIDVVVSRRACTANHMEGMAMKVEWVL
jgi:hypothetical protein